MIVIVDANVIVSNPLLRGAAWDQLRRAIEAGRTTVKLPRFAFDEAVAAYQRFRETKKIEITAAKRTSSRAVSDLLTQAIGVLDAEARAYPEILRTELQAAGVEMVRAPRISHSKLVAKATARRRPFDDKGGGYRDALHWATVLDVVREYADYEDIVFVSDDRRAFGANAKSNDLHPHLVQDLSELGAAPWFRWLRSLNELPVPGIYEDELRWNVNVTAGELVGVVKTALWERSPVELLPRENGLKRDPVAITVLDIGEPDVSDIEIRQYFDEARFRTDFVVLLSFEIAAWFYGDASDDGVVEDRRTVHYAADAHADFKMTAGDDYSFSNVEFGQLSFLPTDEEPPPASPPATYATGSVRRSPYSHSAEVRSRE